MNHFHLYCCNGIQCIEHWENTRHMKTQFHSPDDCGTILRYWIYWVTLQLYRWNHSNKYSEYISFIYIFISSYNLHISTFMRKWKLKTSFLTNSCPVFIVRLSYCIILGVLLFHPNLFATPQEPDEIFINDKSYPLLTPLFDEELSSITKEELFLEILKEVESKKMNMAISTSLRRGWKCKWRVSNNSLYLENIDVLPEPYVTLPKR